jgi:hypothetical protein
MEFSRAFKKSRNSCAAGSTRAREMPKMGDHKLLFSKVEKWVRKQPLDRIFMDPDVSVDLNLTASLTATCSLKGMENVEKVGTGWRKVAEAEA